VAAHCVVPAGQVSAQGVKMGEVVMAGRARGMRSLESADMKTPSWLIVGVVLVAAAGGAAWWLQRSGEGAASYRSAKLERGSVQAAVASSGTVNPVSQVSVGSQVSGQIKEMHADFNTEVKKGQLNAQANIAAVLAGVSKARLDADNAQRDAARKQDLLTRQFISQADFENSRNTAGTLAESLKVTQAQADVARAQAVAAQAVVRQREAALAQAKVDLEHTEIRSPVDGVVIKRSVDVGQTVAASLQAPELFIIARNLSDMQVEASIDEADISRVRAAQKASFTIDAFPGRSFEGAVSQIRKAAVASQNVVTYTVVIGFSNPNATLLPGMTANVRIVTDTRENVLKVPNAALRVRIAGIEPALPASAPFDAASAPRVAREGAAGGAGRQANRGRIYLLGADNKPVARAVRLGITDGVSTELLVRPGDDTLAEGVSVVTGVLGGNTAAGGAGAASQRPQGAGPRPPF